MDQFWEQWQDCEAAIARYLHYRISCVQDAEDLLQEVMLAACRAYGTLRNREQFRAWVVGIARHKYADWLRNKYRRNECLSDALPERSVQTGRFSMQENTATALAMEALNPQEQQLLHLFYFQQLPQEEIARLLDIPCGTVKSRLHHAREHFRRVYPQRQPTKGAAPMHKMPLLLPEYTITPSDQPPFPVKWEELMGWFIVPRLGEKLTWAMYDFPDRIRTEVDDMEVVCRAQVHGIEGVEIRALTRCPMECNATNGDADVERTFVAQLTDTHCRILAQTHVQDGIKRMYTYLDGNDFLDNWGFGEDNCGNETDLRPKGDIIRRGDRITTAKKDFRLDVVGRYTVKIAGKTWDTICVMDVETYMGGMATEQYIDRSGRTVLWRRFNSDDWQQARYGRTWTQMLPDSERIVIDDVTYVHWYDCITSYIL